MNWKCFFGNHSWDVCKCARCGKSREKGHTWDICTCQRCGTVRELGHNWSEDKLKCSKCGLARPPIAGLKEKLDLAIKEGNLQTVQTIASWAPNLLTLRLASNGATPLHLVANKAWHGGGGAHRDVAEWLLRSGVDVHSKESGGFTALHVAAMSLNKEVVEVLLAHGADVNAKNAAGDTPLVLAQLIGHFQDAREVAGMLINRGGHT